MDLNIGLVLTCFTCVASEAQNTTACEAIDVVIAGAVVLARGAGTLVNVCERNDGKHEYTDNSTIGATVGLG